jgi:predicted RNA-binding protein YlqC (UPF0109 family)
VSAFDDEFGLFGDEAGEEEERKSTLGARTIASGETIIDDIEPEDERPRRRVRGGPDVPQQPLGPDAGNRYPRRKVGVKRDPLPAEIAHPRAVELLTFLAKKLVSKPEAVYVEVDPEDLGKVIGRGGRVAQALRTIVRAGAEGRVTVDIVDAGDDEEDDLEDTVDTQPGTAVALEDSHAAE